MARTPFLLIATGSAALLVVLVALYFATRTDSPSSEPTATAPQARRTENAPTVTPTTATPLPSTGGAAPSPIAVKPKPTMTRDSWAPSAAAPSAAATGGGEGSSNENLHYGVAQLRTQTAAVDAAVRECVDKATVAGMKPNGTAVLTHVVTKRGDKYIVEDPGFDSEEGANHNQALFECMSETAKQMKFEGLPRQATSILVTRTVKVENGSLAEHKFVKFSYLQ